MHDDRVEAEIGDAEHKDGRWHRVATNRQKLPVGPELEIRDPETLLGPAPILFDRDQDGSLRHDPEFSFWTSRK